MTSYSSPSILANSSTTCFDLMCCGIDHKAFAKYCCSCGKLIEASIFQRKLMDTNGEFKISGRKEDIIFNSNIDIVQTFESSCGMTIEKLLLSSVEMNVSSVYRLHLESGKMTTKKFNEFHALMKLLDGQTFYVDMSTKTKILMHETDFNSLHPHPKGKMSNVCEISVEIHISNCKIILKTVSASN